MELAEGNFVLDNLAAALDFPLASTTALED